MKGRAQQVDGLLLRRPIAAACSQQQALQLAAIDLVQIEMQLLMVQYVRIGSLVDDPRKRWVHRMGDRDGCHMTGPRSCIAGRYRIAGMPTNGHTDASGLGTANRI